MIDVIASGLDVPANGRPWLTGRIVVGVDGSDNSLAALQHANRLGRLSGARIEAISVWQARTPLSRMGYDVPWSPAAESRRILQEATASTFGSEVPDRYSAAVHEGDAARVLIEASRNADLLIVGVKGRGGLLGLTAGSVSKTCIEHATCPVLVVPLPG